MIHNFRNIILCCSLLSLVSCADSFFNEVEQNSKQEAEGTIVSIRILRPGDEAAPSRSPNGGPYGNGFEPANQWSAYLKGIDYDYKLDNLCLFLLNTQGKSVEEYLNDETSPKATFMGAYYLDEIDLRTSNDINDGHTSHPIDKRYLYADVNIGDIHVNPINNRIVVVANVGDITKDCSTVGNLLDIIAEKAYKTDKGGNIYLNCESEDKISASENVPTCFAMGLYEEPNIFKINKGTYVDPHSTSVTLERLSARVDFKLTQHPSELSQRKDPFAPIPYDVKGSNNETLSRNWITHIRMINSVAQPSYIIRRSADDASGEGKHYLGFEKANDSQIATNYILDPYTNNKAQKPTGYFGNTELSAAKMRAFLPEERVVSREAFAPLRTGVWNTNFSAFSYDASAKYDQYFIVGYPQENILKREQMTKEYATGLLYRTVYEPAMVWKLNDEKNGIVSETVELTRDVLSNGTVPEGGYKSTHYGKTFWMIEKLVPNPTESDRVYFHADTDEDAAKAVQLYLDTHPSESYIAAQKFVDGVAYNYYWLRHSNSQGTGLPFSPMEYSVVRNNIYRVGITSFTGPGAPTTDPEADNPDRIMPITYVHRWHTYEVDEIKM